MATAVFAAIEPQEIVPIKIEIAGTGALEIGTPNAFPSNSLNDGDEVSVGRYLANLCRCT
jgi:hypothetical protein